jgi:thimet oligopeptidase
MDSASVGLGRFPWTLTAEDLRRTANDVVRESTERLDTLVRSSGVPTIAGFLRPLDRILLEVRNVGSHGSFLFAVHPDPAVRTAAREASEASDRFFNAFRTNEPVYRALRSLDREATDGPTRFAVERMEREMRRSGVEKDAESRARLVALNNLIDRIGNQYNENIARLDRSIEVDAPTGLRGLPDDFVTSHPADASGKVRLTTKYPDFHPVMAYAEEAEVRRTLLSAFMNRAYPENLPVLDQLLRERNELARSLGYPTYAAFALEDKMIERPDVARVFLERVAERLREPARQHEARLLERKRKDEPSAARVELWDASFFGQGYYDSKILREEYGFDTKRLRAYLPYIQIRDGLFALCEELFGLRFHRVEAPEVWHPTVETYDVTEGARPLGRIFLDLVPREGKYNHAACFTVREGIGDVQLPQAALVCNFIEPTTPVAQARMQYSEVVTFFHEFGHLLHALFSGHGPWVYTGGSFVEWDFIEAPSQLFEEWARDPATLARFARNPETGEPVPKELLERLKAAEGFGRPHAWLRQVALAAISLELYDRDPAGVDTTVFFREVFGRYIPAPLEPDYHPQAAWGHLTGYSAFYYTYVWSLVIARDLLRPFLEKGNLTDPEIAARYVREILTPGGQRPASALVQAYLGRDFNFDAFDAWVRTDPRPPSS